MGSQVNPVPYPLAPVATPGYPRVTAGVALSAFGYETSFAFSAGASVTDAGAGWLTHIWTLIGKPAGSALTTASIHDPTSLTGAHLGVLFDRPGVYGFRLTTTDSALNTAVSDVVVTVGTAEGYLLIADVNFLQCANRDVKALGNVPVTWADSKNSVTLTQSGSAFPASVADTLGTGLVVTGNASGDWELLATVLAAFGRSGRSGTYAFLVDATSAGLTSGSLVTGSTYYNAAKTAWYAISNGYTGTPNRYMEDRTGNQYTVSPITPNEAKRYGIVVRGLDVRGWIAAGGMAADPAIDSETSFTTGGPVLSPVAPGGLATHNWSSDLVSVLHRQNKVAAAVSTFTRIVLAWRP